MIYVVIYLWSLIIFNLLRINKYRSLRLAHLVALFPFAAIVILRGNVGVDTSTYISIVESIPGRDFFDVFIEPIFLIYSRLLLGFGISPHLIVNTLGVLNLLLLYYAASKIEKQGNLFFLVIYPIFLLDYTMNGLRAGTGVAIFAIAYQQLVNRHYFSYLVYVLLSVLSHVSITFLVALSFIQIDKRARNIMLIITTASLAALFLSSNQAVDYITGKYTGYFESDADSIKGITPAALNIMMSTMLYWLASNRQAIQSIRNTLVVQIILTVLLYILIPYFPWFAARIMWLNLFYACIRTADLVQKNGAKISHIEFSALLAIGALGFASHIRQFLIAPSDLESPFLPYRFIWE